jgi:hypothetical protein
VELEIRRDLVEIGGADDLLPFEGRRADGGDRDRCVLQIFFAPPSGDDDRFDRFRIVFVGRLSRSLRCCRACKTVQRQENRSTQDHARCPDRECRSVNHAHRLPPETLMFVCSTYYSRC